MPPEVPLDESPTGNRHPAQPGDPSDPGVPGRPAGALLVEPAGASGRTGEHASPSRSEQLLRWFNEVLVPVIARDVNGQGPLAWCTRWWEHPEAVARIVALHEAWTVLVEDEEAPGTGASSWWIYHVDPHMSVLLSRDRGPFGLCTRGHKPVPALPLEQPPEGGVPIPIACGPDLEPPDAAQEAARLDSDANSEQQPAA